MSEADTFARQKGGGSGARQVRCMPDPLAITDLP
jgi:hypothetical protein